MKFYNVTIVVGLLIGFMISCSSVKNVDAPILKTEDVKLENGHSIISAEIVMHHFESKNGKVSEFKEYYLRRSVQDYFIKFCEGGVTVSDLEKVLNKQKGMTKSLTLEVEFIDGMWDSCDSEHLVQSRTGEYVVIHKVIE